MSNERDRLVETLQRAHAVLDHPGVISLEHERQRVEIDRLAKPTKGATR